MLHKDGPPPSNLYLWLWFWGCNPTLTPADQATFKPAVKALTSHYNALLPPSYPASHPWSGSVLRISKRCQKALILTDRCNHMQICQAGGGYLSAVIGGFLMETSDVIWKHVLGLNELWRVRSESVRRATVHVFVWGRSDVCACVCAATLNLMHFLTAPITRRASSSETFSLCNPCHV